MTANIDQTQAMKLLRARERRAIYQQKLLKTYGHSLLVIKANYPGSMKHNVHTTMAVVVISEVIKDQCKAKLIHYDQTSTEEGLIMYLIVDEDGLVIKQAMVDIEDRHPLGRLVDVDVFDQSRGYHRGDVSQQARTCFLCGEMAYVCARNQTHTSNEIKNFFISKVERFCAEEITHTILFALLAEASCHPKFGLVTPFTSGSHSDMDFALFIRSSVVIAPMLAIAMTMKINGNHNDDQDIFLSLRELGKEIETAMFEATNGVNTHKGAVFLFLLVLMGYRLAGKVEGMSNEIRRLSQSLERDFIDIAKKQPKDLNHGEILYMQYGLRGVRGQVMNGLVDVFETYLLYFERQPGDWNERLVKTLLVIMGQCEDTTVIHRGGVAALAWLKKRACEVQESPSLWDAFEIECMQRNLSAGGSADLLAIVVLLDRIKRVKKGETNREDRETCPGRYLGVQ